MAKMIHANLLLLKLLALLLLSTNLRTGGEFVDSIIYVDSTGDDDTACLNGGSPCKTLGYVLTNMDHIVHEIILCIMINYEHSVFTDTTSPVVHINVKELIYLEINGGFNSLVFNGAGLSLTSDSITQVILKNLELVQCGDGTVERACLTGEYLKQFSLVDVTLSESIALIDITAMHASCHSCQFNSGGLLLYAPQSGNFSFNITNLLFNSTIPNSSPVLGIRLQSLPPNSSGLITISGCQFDGVQAAYNSSIIDISITRKTQGYYIDIIISNNTVTLSRGGSFINIFSSYIYHTYTKLKLTNNNYTNNTFSIGLIRTYSSELDCNNVTLYMVCNRNHFEGNIGTLMNLNQWPYMYVQIENTTITNNTADVFLISIKYSTKFIQCHRYMNIYLKDLNISYNSISMLAIATQLQGAIFLVQDSLYGAYMHMTSLNVSNATFSNNIGTPLALLHINFTVLGSVTFGSNSAVTGGGLYIDYDTILSIADNASLMFTNNNARYGGAIYIGDNQDLCFLEKSSHLFHDQLDRGNNDAVIGHSIFSTRKWCDYKIGTKCADLDNLVASLPTDIRISNAVSVFPGQPIVLDMIVADCNRNGVLCIADVSLGKCTNKSCSEYGIYLQGLPTMLIYTGLVQTGLAIKKESVLLHSVDVQLLVGCKTPTMSLPATVTATISMHPCPFGLKSLNSTSQQCQCDKTHGQVPGFLCSDSAGVACIKKGYWYGDISGELIAAKCLNLFCSFLKSIACPTKVASDPSNYVLLSQSQDDQCLNGHGGPLCTACAEGKTATYGGLKCIPSHQCKSWHPYMLLLLNMLLPFITGMLLMFIIRLRIGIGSGYLYGPIFYLAVLKRLSDTGFSDSVTNGLVSITTETFLLNMTLLGFIPWCFFRINIFYVRCFKLVPPIVLLLLTLLVTKYTPRLFQKYFRKLPTEGICLLIVISFWSLASTSIDIITPVHIAGLSHDSYRVYYGPEIFYLGNVGHILLWIVAVVILLVLGCITIFLTISPFKIPFSHRLKPLLDEFQSCYKDSYRWYSGVYFTVWMILEGLLINSETLAVQTVLVAITVVHVILQPYCRRWLNAVDTLLFVDLLSIMYLMAQSSCVLLYIAIFVPLFLIVVGVMALILHRFNIVPKINCKQYCRHHKNNQTPKPNILPPTTSVVHCEREPLLRILQEDDQDN